MRSFSVAVVGTILVLAACGSTPDAVTLPAPPPPAAPEEVPSPSTTAVVPPDRALGTATAPAAPAPTSVPTTTTPAPTTTLPPLLGLGYEELVSDLPFPLFVTAPAGDDRLFIVTKDGRVWIHAGGGLLDEPFLDIRDRVRNDGEQGLLGVAFHPDFPADDRVFVHYTAGDGDTVLAEHRLADGTPNVAASDGAELYRTDQPAGNHNGGMVQFGPDGYLYMALGDGGGANDRFGHGQRPETPLAALLRFDVSTPGSRAPAPGNPFDDDPYVWAYGLRNPWRFDIDDGLIYVADVGQNAYEEVSVAPVATPGLNYGWPVTEGLHCFSPRSGCSVDGLWLPILEVAHGDAGTCSITGGFVYRGGAIPEVTGHYFYSDYCGGYLRSFRYGAGEGVDAVDWTEQAGIPGRVTSFGEDAAGELYVTTAEGSVLRIVPRR